MGAPACVLGGARMPCCMRWWALLTTSPYHLPVPAPVSLACCPVKTWVALALYPLLKRLGFDFNLPICLLANQLNNPLTAFPLLYAMCWLGAHALNAVGCPVADVSYAALTARLAAIEAAADGDLTARFVESTRFVFLELGTAAMVGAVLAAAPVAVAASSVTGWAVRRAKRAAEAGGAKKKAE